MQKKYTDVEFNEKSLAEFYNYIDMIYKIHDTAYIIMLAHFSGNKTISMGSVCLDGAITSYTTGLQLNTDLAYDILCFINYRQVNTEPCLIIPSTEFDENGNCLYSNIYVGEKLEYQLYPSFILTNITYNRQNFFEYLNEFKEYYSLFSTYESAKALLMYLKSFVGKDYIFNICQISKNESGQYFIKNNSIFKN